MKFKIITEVEVSVAELSYLQSMERSSGHWNFTANFRAVGMVRASLKAKGLVRVRTVPVPGLVGPDTEERRGVLTDAGRAVLAVAAEQMAAVEV